MALTHARTLTRTHTHTHYYYYYYYYYYYFYYCCCYYYYCYCYTYKYNTHTLTNAHTHTRTHTHTLTRTHTYTHTLSTTHLRLCRYDNKAYHASAVSLAFLDNAILGAAVNRRADLGAQPSTVSPAINTVNYPLNKTTEEKIEQ